MEDRLSPEERQLLLQIAREAIRAVVCGQPLPSLDLSCLPQKLREPGATFVTITQNGALRGCIGGLEPRLPLAEDAQDHAVAAALFDYRFSPLQPEEVEEIDIEISRLTLPAELEYQCPEDLLVLLRPGLDGVIIRDGLRRATFLPQVWEKVSDPADFLHQLCLKMGAPGDLWRSKKLSIQIYHVEEFHETEAES